MAGRQLAEVFTIEPDVPENSPAGRLRELGLTLPEGIACQAETLFPKREGWGWKKDFRARHKLLQAASPLLERCLLPGEEVLYLGKGCRYSLAEFYFLGLWASTINHTVVVITNFRLLLFHTNGKGVPKQTHWMVYYSQIRYFKTSLLGMIILKLNDRRTLTFSGFNRLDRLMMPALIEENIEKYRQLGFDPHTSQSMENLCSHCLEKVAKYLYECDRCQSQFWKPRELAIRSFVFPSWGDFLMGHTTLAVVELLGALVTWGLLLGGSLRYFATGETRLVFVGLTMFIIGNGIDALLTSHLASKGLYPRRRSA